MAKYVLFTRTKKPEVLKQIEMPEEVLQSTMVFDAGAIFSRGSLQVDAKMRNCKVFSQDRKPVVLSALGQMAGCTIIGQDVVIEGDFAGRIEAAGDVEVTNTARVAGVITCAGRVIVGPLVNRESLRIERPMMMATELPNIPRRVSPTLPSSTRKP